MPDSSADDDGNPIHHEEHEVREVKRGRFDDLSRVVVDAGLAVHKALGAGLLESTYEHCLVHELRARGVESRRQVPLPIVYRGARLEEGYRIDLLVENTIIVEVKSVEALSRLHEAQLLTYLRLGGFHVGLLMNFNVPLFKNGLKRFVL